MFIRTIPQIDRRSARHFVDALADEPLERWLAAAQQAGDITQERVVALAALERAIRPARLDLVLWELDDRLDTSGWFCRSHLGREGVAAIAAARVAARALLLRRHIEPVEFDALLDPFIGMLKSDRHLRVSR